MTQTSQALNLTNGTTVHVSSQVDVGGESRSPYDFGTGDFTVEAWVKSPASGGVIASKASVSASPQGWWLGLENGTDSQPVLSWKIFQTGTSSEPIEMVLSVAARSADPPDWVLDATVDTHGDTLWHLDQIGLLDGDAHHVAATRRGHQLNLYVDGVRVAWRSTAKAAEYFSTKDSAYDGSPVDVTNSGDLIWGSDADGGELGGEIDEARIWSVARTNASISDLQFENPGPATPHLVGRWSFDDGDTSTAADSSALGNAGRFETSSGQSATGVYSAGLYQTRIPQCVRFESDTDYVHVSVATGSTYQIRSDPFSVEAWVNPTLGSQSQPFVLAGVFQLYCESDGTVCAALAPTGSQLVVRAASPGPTENRLGDGGWHQVAFVRDASQEIHLYLDGRRLPVTATLNGVAATSWPELDLGGWNNVYLGQCDQSPFIGILDLPGVTSMRGSLDEVRLWTRALSQAEVRQRLYHDVPAGTEGLAGRWSFDVLDSNNHYAVDESGHENDGDIHCELEPAGIDFVPFDQPYLLSQTVLMEDWDDNGSDLTRYRTVFNARGPQNGPLPTTLRLWASTSVSCLAAGTQVTLPAEESEAIEVETNGLGQLSLAFEAQKDDHLSLPAVFARAAFMTEGEQIVVYPDRQLHHRLSQVTGSELLEPKVSGRPALVTFDSDSADHLATLVRSMMASASEHVLQADVEVDDIDLEGLSESRRRDTEALLAGRPTRPLYQPSEVARHVVDDRSDTVQTDYLPVPIGVRRRPGLSYLAAQAFALTFERDGGGGPTSLPVEMPAGEAAGAVTALRSMDLPWRAEGGASRDLLGITDELWNDFVDGVTEVAAAGYELVEDGVEAILQVGEEWYSKLLDSVEDVGEFVSGIFAQVEVTVDQVLDFARSVFDWDNIQTTYQVMEQFLTSTFDWMIDYVGSIGSDLDDALQAAEEGFDQTIDQLIQANQTGTVGGASEPATSQPPQDVRSGYLLSVITQNPTVLDPAGFQPDMSGLESRVEDLEEQILSFIQQNPSADPETSSLYDQLYDLLNHPDGLMAFGLNSLLQILKSLGDVFFDLLQVLVDTVTSWIQEVLTSLREALTTPLADIPVIGAIYERVTGDTQLTILGTFCLVSSIPAVVGYAVSTGQTSGLFTAQEAQDFLADPGSLCPWLGTPFDTNLFPGGFTVGDLHTETVSAVATEDDDGGTVLQRLSWVQGACYFTSTLFQGATALFSDLKPSIGKGVSWVGLASELVSVGCTFPVTDWDSEDNSFGGWSGSKGLATGLWAAQFVPLTLDFVTVLASPSSEGEDVGIGTALRGLWTEFVAPITSGVLAYWQCVGYCAVMVWEGVESFSNEEGIDGGAAAQAAFKGIQNLFAAMPGISQLAKLDKSKDALSETGKSVAIGVQTVGYAGVAILSLIRTEADMAYVNFHASR